jgi:hypothetical protein
LIELGMLMLMLMLTLMSDANAENPLTIKYAIKLTKVDEVDQVGRPVATCEVSAV